MKVVVDSRNVCAANAIYERLYLLSPRYAYQASRPSISSQKHTIVPHENTSNVMHVLLMRHMSFETHIVHTHYLPLLILLVLAPNELNHHRPIP